MLKPVLRLLSEIGMVRLYESGKAITKIDPLAPYFEDVSIFLPNSLVTLKTRTAYCIAPAWTEMHKIAFVTSAADWQRARDASFTPPPGSMVPFSRSTVSP